MSGSWKEKRRRDVYRRLAKERGYRSRAAYKLIQIDDKYRLIKKGAVVVDLGAWPGGWSQVCLERVGPKGFVLAVDILPIEPIDSPNFSSIVLDILSERAEERIREELPRRADVVLSDASVHTTGIRDLDHERQMELAERAFEIAKKVLKKGGNFLVKIFDGPQRGPFLKELKRHFRTVRVVKPPASDKRSRELFLLARGFLGE